MPEDAVVLYEGQLPTSSTLVFTCPAGQTVAVSAVELVNITATAATARVDRVPSGDTDGTTYEVLNESVAANSTVTVDNPVNLEPGDELYVEAGTATAIDCTISGIRRPV